MFQHILVPSDGSLLSAATVDKALDLAREIGAKVTVLTAVEPFHVLSTDSKQLADTRATYERHAKAEAERRLAALEEEVRRLRGLLPEVENER